MVFFHFFEKRSNAKFYNTKQQNVYKTNGFQYICTKCMQNTTNISVSENPTGNTPQHMSKAVERNFETMANHRPILR